LSGFRLKRKYFNTRQEARQSTRAVKCSIRTALATDDLDVISINRPSADSSFVLWDTAQLIKYKRGPVLVTKNWCEKINNSLILVKLVQKISQLL